VREALDPQGLVFVTGELWTARTTGETIPVGVIVEVLAVEGLCLVVRPAVIGAPAAARSTP
jgi:membrane-bound ClpP family serine protease